MTKANGPTDKPADAPAVTPPNDAVLASARLRVTQRDLNLYAALVGVPPETLLIPDEPTPQADGSAAARAWQSVTQSVVGLTVRLARPDLTSWVRRVSGHAKRQIRQARRRLIAASTKPRA